MYHLEQTEQISLYDPQEPGGEYSLDLQHPYDRVRKLQRRGLAGHVTG